MLSVQGNTWEGEGVCTSFLFNLRNAKAKHQKRFPSTVLRNIHISTCRGFPLPFTRQRKSSAARDSRAQERWGNHRQRALEKQQSEENISHAGNRAEICPTENKSVRSQAGTWAICEQQKEPKAASELLAAEQLVWFE